MSKSLNKLLSQLVELHPKYIDLSLKRILNLLEKLGNPHLNIPPVIHIAGTNGKGSTLSFIYHILKNNGFNTHVYISPHLKLFNERIILSNKIIKTEKLIETLKHLKKINKDNPITFFEIITAAAFLLFSLEKADFLILETGLGGRLDATNVIKSSLIDIITPIGIDHQEFLGETLVKITNEKLGIIKKNSTIIISKQKKIVDLHIRKKIKKNKNNKLFYNDHFRVTKKDIDKFTLKYENKEYKFKNPKLIGDHQIENASTAVAAILKIKNLGYNFTNKNINIGINQTRWPGRLEKIKYKNIEVYLDGSHNIDGAKKLLEYFKNMNIKIWIVIGMLNNKDIDNFLKILKPITQGIIAISIPGEKNSYTCKEILEKANKLKIHCFAKNSINQSNKFLLEVIKPKSILITGSLYLVGKIRNKYL